MRVARDRCRMFEQALLALAIFLGISALPMRAALADGMHVVWEAFILPVAIDGKTYHLDALMLRPDDNQRHPLAMISHGSPRDEGDRPNMTPAGMRDQMMEFVRRGWVAVSVLRRGYGQSDGGWAEGYGNCKSPDYYDAGLNGGADIAASIRLLAQNPHVDGSKVIAVGVSAGAFATVALTADPPPELVAAISFAAGRGSQQADTVCGPDQLVYAFAQYGKKSRIPMLWVYSENDHFFSPKLARQFYDAFTAAGGHAQLVAAPAFGDDGHHLFSGQGATIWTPMVDRFLAEQKLTLLPQPAVLASPNVAAPARLSDHGREDFVRYLLLPPHKAFAIEGAHYGFVSGQIDDGAAKAGAIDHCKAPDGKCTVVFVNDTAVR